jgi:L-ascorbate metabolism protein UlaG (beta-lactamase superfamily)
VVEETVTLEQDIRDIEVAPGTVACVWLGQASYLLKPPAGVIVMIDPYLSDWAEQMWGLKRVIDSPIDPERLHPDLLLISHWHEDHFDVPVVKQWARMAFPGVFAGPDTVTVRAQAFGWPDDRVRTLSLGQQFDHQDVKVTAVFARHDTPFAPTGDAFGYLVETGGVKIWYVGDTEYDARLRPMKDESIDVALTPINGVGGNLNADEAALLMYVVAPRIAVPMHYNMWNPEAFGQDATLDPQQFANTHAKLEGTAEVQVLNVGEIVAFTKA